MTSLPEGTKEVAHIPIQVTLPDGSTISSIKTIILTEPKQLSIAARIANVFPKLTQGALISVGQYCDYGCIVVYSKDNVKVIYNNEIILTGDRSSITGLWYLNL